MQKTEKSPRAIAYFRAHNKRAMALDSQCDGILEASTYSGLRAILNTRRVRLMMTMEEVDYRSGLPSGYCAKLLCGKRMFGDVSLPLMLGALGVKIVIVPEYADGAAAKVKRGRNENG